MRPVDAKWPTTQGFGSFPTAGVVGNWNGTTVQRLVAQYGNYQPFGHAGEDIGCPIGTLVHAIADGVVVWADWGTNLPGDDSDWGYRQRWYLYKSFPGIVTVIQHDGWLSVYGHLSNNDAAPKGTRVKEGQLIALSGDTGGVAPHLHVAAIVDTSYRTGDGLIYGCTDPSKFYGSLSYAGTITPVQEDDMATVPQEEWAHVLKVVNSLADNAATKKDLAGVPDAVLTKQVPYKDPVTGQDTGQTTSLATMAGYADFQASQTRALIQQGPAGVAEQINAAGLAEAVRDELVKLIGGK